MDRFITDNDDEYNKNIARYGINISGLKNRSERRKKLSSDNIKQFYNTIKKNKSKKSLNKIAKTATKKKKKGKKRKLPDIGWRPRGGIDQLFFGG